eukprot:CAMPEP_0206528896 /NCGR_PEP_ID=MMETSP0325_2-20121206/2262_1 /ASSEMBLY_ACC=CAM_ASM_000347 /TAXON_ID=2866 /ORGANISM="Crypthecodinium cohnii, Strain Seligo" /LENGTH=675 /DNA_ID=CAMNT_0054024675 /DNA_START=48 /DNA_END=2072 /DNA_ORIENTATION=-
MPSLKEKKAQEAAGAGTRKGFEPPTRPPPTTAPKAEAAAAVEQADKESVASKKVAGDRLDYSRFQGIGADTKAERLQTGDIVWDDLSKEEKTEVWKAEDQFDEILDKKRKEDDTRKKELQEKPPDLSWVQGRKFDTYEAFCVARVEATLKKGGNEAFQRGELEEAKRLWQGGVDMILSLGSLPSEGTDLICTLRNNLAQLFLKEKNWNKVKEMTDKVLEKQPTNQKALFRRAQAFFAFALWERCLEDLEKLTKLYPDNKEAQNMLQQVQGKICKDKKKLTGKAVSDIAVGMKELAADGSVRKLRIEQYGEGDPDAPPSWFSPDVLKSDSRDRVVVTCQLVIWSHGGEELYNSREYRPRPDTKQARDELKEYMEMVNFLDQEANKMPRLVGDFYQKVKKRPVRWFLGDPGIYKGFDLAVQSMSVKEKALFEMDQSALSASVDKFYEGMGFHSGIAGLPPLTYHIEEERLAILEDEMPPDELDLENRRQRSVRVELELLGHVRFRDVSTPNPDGSLLHAVLHAGFPDAPVIRKGDFLRGAFFINRPFDSSLLVQNPYVEWRLGVDEGDYEKLGENNQPLRSDGGPFVPKCVGEALLKVDWEELRLGALVEVRYRAGPDLDEIAPQYGNQFAEAREERNRTSKRRGAMCSLLVQTFPPNFSPNSEGGDPNTTGGAGGA